MWNDPYFILRNESNGQYFFGQLAWPVNYFMAFDKNNGFSFKVGPLAKAALRVIAVGETVTTPAVHLCHVKADFDTAVQTMHDHIRRTVLPKRKLETSYRVQYLIPEDQPLTVYRGDDYNETNMKKCIDVAASVGVELFILDGPDWAKSYGDWVPKEKWFPRGLDPLREYAHEKGMLFGVYAEWEGGRGDWSQTKAFQENPNWFVRRNPDYDWANFLNLAIPQAAAYAKSEFIDIIERFQLDIYRHDQNGCFGGEGSETMRDGFLENDYWRYYEAFYGISRRIHEKYPELILHQASGGGSRLELATASYWHEHYLSDEAIDPMVYKIINGVTVYLPPEILVSPHGMAGPDRPDFITMLRGSYALGCTPMIFNGMLPKSVDEFQPEVKEQFLHHSNIYKTFMRPLLPALKVYHHAPVSATGGVDTGDWLAIEFAAPDRSQGWATFIRFSENEPSYLFKPKGLDGQKMYRVTFDNTGEKQELKGSDILRDGLSIRLEPKSPASELLLFEALTAQSSVRD